MRQTSTLSHHTPVAGNILIAALQNPTTKKKVQKDFLATKRKVLNNDRLIKKLALCFLTGILLGSLILLLKVNDNLIQAFFHINKIKVIQSAFRKKKAITI